VRWWRVDFGSVASLSCVSLEHINVLVSQSVSGFPIRLSYTHTFRHHPLLLVPSNSYKQNKHNTHLNCHTILGWPPVSSTIPFQTSTSTKQPEDTLTATQYLGGLQHQVSNKSPQNNRKTYRLQVNTRAGSSTRCHTNHIPLLLHTKS
jgi:hypothetical protein